jgi:hypothetical protein
MGDEVLGSSLVEKGLGMRTPSHQRLGQRRLFVPKLLRISFHVPSQQMLMQNFVRASRP